MKQKQLSPMKEQLMQNKDTSKHLPLELHTGPALLVHLKHVDFMDISRTLMHHVMSQDPLSACSAPVHVQYPKGYISSSLLKLPPI